MEAKIKAIRAEYQQKINAIRAAAKASIEKVKDILKTQKIEKKIETQKKKVPPTVQ